MQRIKTPRIYVDYISWLNALGWNMHPDNTGIGFNVDKIYEKNITANTTDGIAAFGNRVSSSEEQLFLPKELKYNFCAILGHNFMNKRFLFGGRRISESGTGYHLCFPDKSNIINCGEIDGTTTIKPEYNGFSIMELTSNNNFSTDGNETDIIEWSMEVSEAYENPEHLYKFSSWALGGFYDFDNAPDLQLTQTFGMEGITNQTTKGGVSLSDVKYKGNPKWGELGAWELDDGSGNAQLNARSGRRSWDLSFSFISNTNMFPTSSSGSGIITDPDEYDSSNISADGTYTDDTLLVGDDFVSAVWNRTMGGRLRFLLQLDKNNSSADQFAICKFQQDSLDIQRVANNLYNIKLKIREVW